MTASRLHAPLTILALAAALAACGKHGAPAPAPAPAPVEAPAPAPVAAPAPPAAAEDPERAQKQARLDYATMEDGYINDAKGQWAATAKASSTFGDEGGKTPSAGSEAKNMVGAPDNERWTNNHQDIGFDTVEAGFARPVAATELRMVCNDNAALSISKIELQGEDGKWSVAWSGLSDFKPDRRGPRSWFVKAFAKTASPVKAVKLTFANNVASGYKEINSIQLVGE